MISEQTRDTAGSKLWKGFATIVFLAQAAASVILFVNVLLTGMIPEKYLYALGIILWLLLMVNALLLFVGMKRPHSAKVFIKRLAAVLLALLICSVSTSSAISKQVAPTNCPLALIGAATDTTSLLVFVSI